MKKHNKTRVFVGMEPTGHYWYGFGCHLQNMSVEFGMVNPYHVKRTKELWVITSIIGLGVKM